MNNMTMFALWCGLMLAVALVWVLRPLFNVSADQRAEGSTNTKRAYPVMAFIAVTVVMLSSGMYLHITSWPWSNPGAAEAVDAAQAANADIQAEVTAFQARVNANPQDMEGWISLGDALVRAGNYAQAQNAYQSANELSNGQNVDALAGLAEALVLTDPASTNDRVAALVEAALKLAPTHPKALWYGGLVALQSNEIALARDRFKSLLALDPPESIRTILQGQIERLDQQLGQPSAPAGTRRIQVKVSLAASLKAKLTQPMTLFVLARNPGKGGPPLAVERHQSSELPLQVELTRDDAMMPTMSLMNADEVEVVARLSTSGTPVEQSGDLFGSAHYSFSKQGNEGAVTIEINQQVP